MIQTKVARVVSPTELIFAAGSDDGVEEGMEFIVYTLSDPVTDPDTGEALGRIEIVKARLIAAHVQDHMTTARTKSRTVKRVEFSRADMMAREMVRDPQYGRSREYSEVVFEQMAVEKVAANTNRDLVVRVGDLVRTVVSNAIAKTGKLALA